jgi:hypothetical protein
MRGFISAANQNGSTLTNTQANSSRLLACHLVRVVYLVVCNKTEQLVKD